jgi:hypothetical protein
MSSADRLQLLFARYVFKQAVILASNLIANAILHLWNNGYYYIRSNTTFSFIVDGLPNPKFVASSPVAGTHAPPPLINPGRQHCTQRLDTQ